MAGLGLVETTIGTGSRAGLFAVSLAYVELIDRTLYLNHYYWLVLTATVMVFLPLDNSFSIDSRAGRVADPGWYPAWVVWVLRFQVGMVYFFAGLAKLNSDWLWRAEPLATWLPARSEMWLIGPVLALPAGAYALSWAGALFDLTVVGWLSWRRTRLTAYVSGLSRRDLGPLPFDRIVPAPDEPLRSRLLRPGLADSLPTPRQSRRDVPGPGEAGQALGRGRGGICRPDGGATSSSPTSPRPRPSKGSCSRQRPGDVDVTFHTVDADLRRVALRRGRQSGSHPTRRP